jgi:hypothetical protein
MSERLRLPAADPRTIARDIPGVLDALFPHLLPGIVAFFNRKSRKIAVCKPVPKSTVDETSLQKAMLFELAFAVGEQLISREQLNWPACIEIAVARQRRHFDARVPEKITEKDKSIALAVGLNLAKMLEVLQSENGGSSVTRAPHVPGYEWIASGTGDFSIGSHLVEVKCTIKHFSSADYRQLIMYWLLAYAGKLQGNSDEWQTGVLLNPRSAKLVQISFEELVGVTGGGRSKLEILEIFSSIIATRPADIRSPIG